MKKYIAVLSAALFLSSCSCSKNASDENILAEIPNREQTVFEIDGGLPAIGEFSGANVRRFYEEYTPYFIPSDEYGTVIPFIGDRREFFSAGYENSERSFYSYGLCTEDGTIVMDANPDYGMISYEETSDGFGYYVLSENYEKSPDSEEHSETILVPKSGEWVISLVDGEFVISAESGLIITYLTLSEDGTARTTFYDYGGNKLNTYEGVGVFRAYTGGNIIYSGYDNDTQSHTEYYSDIFGNVLLGPYERIISSFNEKGVSAVRNIGGECFLADVEGNRITQGYKSIVEVKSDNGRRSVFQALYSQENKSDIFDADGSFLGTAESGKLLNVRLPDNGYIYYCIGMSGEWVRLSDGSVLKNVDYGKAPNNTAGNDNFYLYRDTYNTADRSAFFTYADGSTAASFDDFESCLDISSDGSFIAYMSGIAGKSGAIIEPDKRKLHIYDVDKAKNVLTLDSWGGASFAGQNDRYAMLNVYTAEQYTVVFDTKTGKSYFDGEYVKRLGVGEKDYFIVCAENSSTLYDGDMNVLLRIFFE